MYHSPSMTPGRLTVLLTFLLVIPLAAGREAAAERLPSRTYSMDDGLAHNRVKRIVQDSRGFLWFCTADGLSRFDGAHFTNYRVEDGLPAPSINDLLESTDGVYWVATNTVGVVRFNLRSEPRYTLYPISREPVTNRVNRLYRDRAGTLWAGTDGGLFQLRDPARDVTFQPVALGIEGHPDVQVQVWALLDDANGGLWIGTKFSLVHRFADGHTTSYRLQSSASDDVVRALVRDRSGTIWIGYAGGVIAFDPASSPQTGHHYAMSDGLPTNTVLALQQTSDGRLWIGTAQNGLAVFDGKTVRAYEVGHRFSDSVAGSITADREDNIWLGTQSGGAIKVSSHGWITYGEADGVGDSVGAAFESADGELYVSSRPWRISRIGKERFTTLRPGLPATVTDDTWRDWSGVIQDHTGQWWIATRQGLYRFPKVDRFDALARTPSIAVYTTRDGLANNDLTKLFEDSRGDIWIASFVPEREPLARWERATNRIHRYGEQEGLKPFTSALVFGEDKRGSVWIGFREGGIARYREGRFTVFGSEAGVPAGSVEGLYLDPSDRLWLAVPQEGLCRVDGLGDERPRVNVYTRAQGLTSNRVMAVTGDREGRIYVAHIRGIDRIDPGSGQVQRYSSADGLPVGDFRSALRDRSGALWFSTTSGLSRFVPGPETPIAPPRILIGAVQVAGMPWQLSPLGQDAVSLHNLEPDQANVQIDFFGLDLRAGETLRYQYMLEGTRGGWSPPSAQRTINYANLAAGTYRFLVRAVSADGTPSTQPASVSFAILPPIWLRGWFLFLAITGIGTAVAGFVYSRTQYLRARQRAADALRRSREERLAELERVRTRIATDLHDDVGSSLTRISLLSEVVQQRLHSSDAAVVDPLASIAGISRELVDAMSDIVWAINPNKDHLSDLSQRMRHFASDVFTARQVAFRFHTPDPDHDTALGANIRRELFLIFKEAVNNVVRHSGCGVADLELRAEPGALVLRVHDNGRGFDATQAMNGHGLISMRKRAEGLGGQLEIASEPGRGTTLTIRIPT